MSTIYSVKKKTLSDIADAIRAKAGMAELLTPSGMVDAIGQLKTGGAALNIAYGDTAPEDTTKLWVKCPEPAMVKVVSNLGAMTEELEVSVGAIPTAVLKIAAAAVGSKVYMFGGIGASSTLDTINMFDTQTNTLITLSTKLPVAMHSLSAAAVGTKIYLFGGNASGAQNTIRVFDTENHTISTLAATLPLAADRIASAVVGTKIFLFGGMVQNSASNAVNMFDTQTNTITSLSAKLPVAAHSLCAAASGAKIYLFGGSGSSAQNTIRVFDAENYAYSTLDTTIPADAGVYGCAVAQIGTKVYLFGGKTASEAVTDSITAFDMESGTISVLSVRLPTKAWYCAAATLGAEVCIIGGKPEQASGYLSTIHKFVASAPLAADTVKIEASLADNVVNLFAGDDASVEIGIANVYCGNDKGYAEKVPAAVYKDGAWVSI